ncbi:MAG: 2-phospho-L-lactate guanylyltransferase [Anaerolineaceae bacterium]|nr:2-phospho-L-lactate guanylyltransferase [Anaerolineaceae bacterium]
MGIWTIIPVKPLNRAKSRLAQVLSPEEREQLAELMLRHVLATVRNVPQIMGTLVISRDSRALAIAREFGARTVQESGAPELNNALMRATQVVTRWNSAAVLVLPADLPLVAPEDLTAMIELGPYNQTVVIATDQNEDGTNALFIRPPGVIDYAYGPGSFRRHIELAQEAGADVKQYQSPRLLLDIDLPADLEIYRELAKVGEIM